jgi:hypothetical protein
VSDGVRPKRVTAPLTGRGGLYSPAIGLRVTRRFPVAGRPGRDQEGLTLARLQEKSASAVQAGVRTMASDKQECFIYITLPGMAEQVTGRFELQRKGVLRPGGRRSGRHSPRLPDPTGQERCPGTCGSRPVPAGRHAASGAREPRAVAAVPLKPCSTC